MKKCDICGGKIGFMNTFHCQDGAICKNCYRIVSNHYANTITGMTLVELKKAYVKNAQPLDMGEDGFQTTRKIGTFLLLDENRHKFCILNNQKVTGQHARPEIIPYEAVRSFRLNAEPGFSVQQLSAMVADKNCEQVVKKLTVEVYLKTGKVQEITIIPTPVRASSFACRKGFKIAEEILDCLADIKI